ncbi:AraC family transcriptional regulator [Neobacillus kokaensis]|uniref:AraC family transcriptional regulator n=1 Tax=Neobacillus kokaensis TaxID=2759023 RepID=A0ABQ3N9Z1_9BACI|nr:AraC family transcriptional regulator [Neobacillus kokaensis]GHI00708.1 AraC family transcriptional regulator [Neobacillus kokaensis]
METNILFCGYSYHINGYHSQHKSGYPVYLFRLQTEGSCEIVVKGKTFSVKKGDLLLIKPGDHYELLIKKGQNSGDYNLGCEGDWIDEWWSRFEKPAISRIDINEHLLSLWRQLLFEKRRPLSSQNEELTGYLLRALCISFERAVKETKHPYAVTRMMRFIEENAPTAFKVEDVANHAGLSISRSVHLFKNSVGKTMMEYAQEIRLSIAIDRMKYTTMTLEHIAAECGFGTYPYFHKVFKKKYGVSPGSFRRQE